MEVQYQTGSVATPQTQSLPAVPVVHITPLSTRDEVIALVKENTPQPENSNPSFTREQIIEIMNDVITADKSYFVTNDDVIKAIDKKLQQNPVSYVITEKVTSMINQSATQLRSEMNQEREKLETRISDVQSTLTEELKNVTNPFA